MSPAFSSSRARASSVQVVGGDVQVLYPLEEMLTVQNIRHLIVQLLDLLHTLHIKASMIHGNVSVDHILYRPSLYPRASLDDGQVVLIAFDFSHHPPTPSQHPDPPSPGGTSDANSKVKSYHRTHSRSVGTLGFLPAEYLDRPGSALVDDVGDILNEGAVYRRHDLESVVYVAMWCALVVQHRKSVQAPPLPSLLSLPERKMAPESKHAFLSRVWASRCVWSSDMFGIVKHCMVHADADGVRKTLLTDFEVGASSNADEIRKPLEEREMEKQWVWLERLFVPFVQGITARKKYLEAVRDGKIRLRDNLNTLDAKGAKDTGVDKKVGEVPVFDMRTLGGLVDYARVRQALDDDERSAIEERSQCTT